MKTELGVNISWIHQLMVWCEKTVTKKASKFMAIYGLGIAIIGVFDYIWMPFLIFKFKFLAFFPLFISLFIVCMIGLGLYEFFKEDVFLKEKMKASLGKKGKCKFTQWFKRKMNSSPKATFVFISLENPLQAYIYCRGEDKVKFLEAIRLIGIGSFFCAFFWGVLIDVLILLWYFGLWIMRQYL